MYNTVDKTLIKQRFDELAFIIAKQAVRYEATYKIEDFDFRDEIKVGNITLECNKNLSISKKRTLSLRVYLVIDGIYTNVKIQASLYFHDSKLVWSLPTTTYNQPIEMIKYDIENVINCAI